MGRMITYKPWACVEFCQRSLQMRAHAAGTHPWFRCQNCQIPVCTSNSSPQKRRRNSSPKLPHQISASGIVPELKMPVRVQSPPGAHLFTSRLQRWTVWPGHGRYHRQQSKAEACRRFPSGRGTILLWNLISFPGLVQDLWDRPRLSRPGNQASNQARD